MDRKGLEERNAVDFNQIPFIQAVMENSATHPTEASGDSGPLVPGRFYFNTTDNKTYIYTATGWQATAQQTALDLKANLASPTFTGTVGGVSVSMVSGAAPLASPTFTGTVNGITASMVGLPNVNNTADASKPVSTAQQTALNLKANLASPTFTGTVSGVTASMVGLGNVSLDYAKLVALLTGAIQEQQVQINALTAAVAALLASK